MGKFNVSVETICEIDDPKVQTAAEARSYARAWFTTQNNRGQLAFDIIRDDEEEDEEDEDPDTPHPDLTDPEDESAYDEDGIAPAAETHGLSTAEIAALRVLEQAEEREAAARRRAAKLQRDVTALVEGLSLLCAMPTKPDRTFFYTVGPTHEEFGVEILLKARFTADSHEELVLNLHVAVATGSPYSTFGSADSKLDLADILEAVRNRIVLHIDPESARVWWNNRQYVKPPVAAPAASPARRPAKRMIDRNKE